MLTTWSELVEFAIEQDSTAQMFTEEGCADMDENLCELMQTGSITLVVGGRTFEISLCVKEMQ